MAHKRGTMRYAVGAVVALAVSLGATNARAAVIYEQVRANSFTSAASSTLNFLGGSPGYTAADDFTLASNEVVTGVNWWGHGQGGEDFQFIFYADATGNPGAVLHTTGGTFSRVEQFPGHIGAPVFYSANLTTPFAASAGTKFWLSVFNQAPDAAWAWLSAEAPGNGERQRLNTTTTWGVGIGNTDLAFALTSVPEPGSLLLLATGIVAARLRRQRFSR